MEEKKEKKDQQFVADVQSLLLDASRGWRMTLGAGALSREWVTLLPTSSLTRKGPHLKTSPITGFLLTAAGFTAQIDITTTQGKLLTETMKTGRRRRECSWAGHFRNGRRAVRAAAAICNSGRATSRRPARRSALCWAAPPTELSTSSWQGARHKSKTAKVKS